MQIKHYDVVGELGRGGMGAVYRVRHRELGVVRALKVMFKPEDPRHLGRFEREALALADVSHPNVVGIHEAGVSGAQPYFVMDLVEGRPLSDLLAEEELDWQRALRIAIGICRGVAALHERGVVHRDLKPDNVVLTSADRPVVIDLGLAVAHTRDQRMTKTGVMLGTLSYMAPEQFYGDRGSTQSDVYALGLITYELLTGEPATPSGTPHEIAAAILHGKRPRPSDHDRTLPASLDRLLASAMDWEPGVRPPDAGALADALTKILERPGPSRAFVSRRGMRAVAAALGCALLAGAFLVSRPEQPTTAAPSDPPAAEPPAPSGPTAAELAKARERWVVIQRETEPRRRLALVDEWLAAFADDPRGTEVKAERRELLRQVPLAAFDRREPAAAALVASGFCTLSTEEVPGRGNASVVHRWTNAGRDEGRKVLAGLGDLLVASPDGERIAAGGFQGFLVVYAVEAKGLRELDSPRPPVGLARVRAVAFDPTGRRLAFGGEGGGVVRVASLAGDGPTRDLSVPGSVRALAFSPEGTHLAVPDGKHLRVFDLATGNDVTADPPRFNDRIVGLGFTPDGARLAALGRKGELVLCGARTGRELARPRATELGADDLPFAHRQEAFGLGFSSNVLYTVGGNSTRGEIFAWDTEQAVERTDRRGPPRLAKQEPVAIAADPSRLLVVYGYPRRAEQHRARLRRVELWSLD